MMKRKTFILAVRSWRPREPAIAACWHAVVEAASNGWIDEQWMRQAVEEIAAGTGPHGYEEFDIWVDGDQATVVFVRDEFVVSSTALVEAFRGVLGEPTSPPDDSGPSPDDTPPPSPPDLAAFLGALAGGTFKEKLAENPDQLARGLDALVESARAFVVASTTDDPTQKEIASEKLTELRALLDEAGIAGTDALVDLPERMKAALHASGGVDPAQLTAGLRSAANWLEGDESKIEEVEAFLDHLERTLGPAIGLDPARKRRERAADAARSAIAEVFSDFRAGWDDS